MSIDPDIAIELTVSAVILFLAYLLFQLARSADEDGHTYKSLKWFMLAYIIHAAVVASVLVAGLVDEVEGMANFLFFVPLIVFAAIVARQKIEGGLSLVQYFSTFTFVGFQVIRIPLAFILSELTENKGLTSDSVDMAINVEIAVGFAAIPIGLISMRADKVSWRGGLVYNILGLVSWINLSVMAASSLMTADLLTGYPAMMLMFVLQLCFLAHLVSAKHFLALIRSKGTSEVSR